MTQSILRPFLDFGGFPCAVEELPISGGVTLPDSVG